MPDEKTDQKDSGFWTTTTKIATAILAVTAILGPAFKFVQHRYAEHHPTIIGVWSGRPDDHRFPPLAITIYPNSDSTLGGTLSSPCEHVTATPIQSISLNDVDLKLTITQLAGSPPITYVGRVQPASPPQIVGRITQGDVNSSFILSQGEWKGECDK
jgi:hypothetical protein